MAGDKAVDIGEEGCGAATIIAGLNAVLVTQLIPRLETAVPDCNRKPANKPTSGPENQGTSHRGRRRGIGNSVGLKLHQ